MVSISGTRVGLTIFVLHVAHRGGLFGVLRLSWRK